MSKQPTWIWYYGDFEIRQLLLVDTRRMERGYDRPAPWQLDDCWHSIVFKKTYDLTESEKIKVLIDGSGSVRIDGKYQPKSEYVTLPAGKHELVVETANSSGLPAIYVEGKTVISDESWAATADNFTFKPVGFWNFDLADVPPSKFSLPVREIALLPLKADGKVIFDAERETYSAIKLSFSSAGKGRIYYGESLTEVLSDDAHTRQEFDLEAEVEFPPRAFRYVRVEAEGLESIKAYYEYLPLEWPGKFRCSDSDLNKIWDVARYTLELNSREFYLDGIKRDGYVWSGDAYQSYLLNYYSSFDLDICRRTTVALGGKAPRTRHINTINDYTFYWILGLEDYYLFTGDVDFLRRIFPTALEWIDFVISRTDEMGLVRGMENDWIFVDWNLHLDKEGPICVEQMLYARSLDTVCRLGKLLGYDCSKYEPLAKRLYKLIEELYWDSEQGAYIDSFTSGRRVVNRHANIFAIRYGFADGERARLIAENVVDNPAVPAITTPYFKFYETESLCLLGKYQEVLSSIESYWGGMLREGATSFWEEYDPNMKGDEHYAMYGDPFGKSLCHAWGASPIYLLGRFYLGVYPTAPGYGTFTVCPHCGGLEFVEGTVPTARGDIRVKIRGDSATVFAPFEGGRLIFGGKEYDIPAGEEFTV